MMFSDAKKGTKIGIVAGVILLTVVTLKIGHEGYTRFSQWQLEQAKVAAEAEQVRLIAEEKARELRQKVEVTTITVDEALAAVEKSDNPKDWIGKYEDAWGNKIKIFDLQGSRKGLAVVSAGPDGEFETVDDIRRDNSKFSISGAVSSLIWDKKNEEIK